MALIMLRGGGAFGNANFYLLSNSNLYRCAMQDEDNPTTECRLRQACHFSIVYEIAREDP